MDKKTSPQEEGKDMSSVIENKKLTIQEILDRISAKAETLSGEDGMVELNPNNPLHKEWFEQDKYKGK